MKVIDHIAESNGKTRFTFEILPPLKDKILNLFLIVLTPLWS